MDSLHLSETQNTPLNFKSTASNTSPSLCGCDIRDYGQTLQPAFCLRALYPGVSKCKHSQEKPEEKFAAQPFFPSLPLFPPFFHNSGIPPSISCPHNTHSEASPSEETKQTSEPNLSPNDYSYCQKGKCDFRMNTSLLEEEVQKSSMLGPEKQFLGYPFLYPNLPESQMNALLHRCSCGDSFPWTCSSLLVPIISYCVFWNSQRANMNLSLGNHSSSSQETTCKKSTENPVDKHSQANVNVTSTRSVKAVEEVNNNSTDIDRNHGEGELRGEKILKLDWEKEDQENIDQNSVKSSSFLTFDSINYTERNCIERLEGSNTSGTGRIEEAMDTDAEQIESLKLNENDSNTSLPNDSLKGDDSLLSEGSRPSSSLQAEKSRTLISEAQGSSSVLMIPVENISNASISNNQENDSDDEKKFMSKATKPHSLKKFIKTFTLIDQTSDALQDGVRVVPDAGAGDVGGSNCYGYKVNISSLELDHQDRIRQETQTEENLDSKEFFLKDDLDLEKNKMAIFSEKSTEESPKGRRSFKSGIAKLKNNSNSKGYKSDEEQIIKYNKNEICQKEHNIVKRRHCCFPNDNSVSVTEKSLKILKIRNCTEVLPQTQVPEKQQKAKNATNQLVKKEEKTKIKVQLGADSQKYVKNNKK